MVPSHNKRSVLSDWHTISICLGSPSKRKRGGKFTIGFAGRICIEKDWEFVPVLVRALKDGGLDFKVDLVLSMYEKGDDIQAETLRKGIISSIVIFNSSRNLPTVSKPISRYL